MLRIIRELRPRWVVGENVLGLVNWDRGLVFEEVQADLEAEGYEVQPYVLPACAVNAPHRRDRVWFVAHAKHSGSKRRKGFCGVQSKTVGRPKQADSFSAFGENGATSNTNHDGHASTENGQGVGKRDDANKAGAFDAFQFEGRAFSDGVVTDAASLEDNWDRQGGFFPFAAGVNEQGATPDAPDIGLQQSRGAWERWAGFTHNGSVPDWGNFPQTQPTIRAGNDGFSSQLDGITFPKWRNESIKAAGNAIVPQVAYQIFRAIELYEIQNGAK